jgi:gamma-D-glutamyl-L-lysine dipeptidyl-peptidase
MVYVVCCVPVSPLRAEASHRAEMVSQLLFGEAGIMQEETKDFIRVKCLYDGYEGWCQRSQLAVGIGYVPEASPDVLVSDWTDKVSINGATAFVSMGTPVVSPAHVDITIGPYRISYLVSSPWNAATAKPSPDAVRSRAMRFLNTPYLWGGRSVFGIDCSGFAQQVFRFFNIPLLRDARQQAAQGEAIGFLQEGRCGDLAFFDDEEGLITHVGILLSDQEIIHASGKVRIDKIDNAGIVNTDTHQRTHKLRIIKRYF